MRIKKYCLIISMFALLSGCGTSKDVDYVQKELVQPDRIVLENRATETKITYEKDSEKYLEIYENIQKNWWKYDSTENLTVADDELITPETLGDLRTTSEIVYANNEMVFLSFIYEEQNMNWTRSSIEEFRINQLNFVIPKDGEEGKNTKSFYQVMIERNEKSSAEGIFAYYFNDGLYNILSESGQTVNSVYEDTPTDIGLDYFSDITTDEMQEYIFNNNGWTQLTDHRVYWNSLSKQVAIVNVFSEKAPEKHLENARDYENTVGRYRNYVKPTSTIETMWKRIPKDADIIIQVYAGDELISQDIYQDMEQGLFYTETHYVRGQSK